MFDIGARVVVLNSSFSGSTGPKKGSVGYVDNLFSVGADYDTLFDEENEWFVRHHRIHFVRYGFEKAERIETRFFIGIVPYITGHRAKRVLEGLDSLASVVDESIKHVEDFNPDKHNFFDEMRYMVANKYGKKNIHVGMLALSTPVYDLMSCSKNDLRAWVECVLMNQTLMTLAQEVLEGNPEKLENTLQKGDIEYLLALKKDRNLRTEVIEAAMAHEKSRDKLITRIRKLVAIALRPRSVKKHQANLAWLKKGRFNTRSREIRGIRMILEGFGRHTGRVCYDEALKVNANNAIFQVKAQFLTALSQRMVSLARSLDREAEEVQTQTVKP